MEGYCTPAPVNRNVEHACVGGDVENVDIVSCDRTEYLDQVIKCVFVINILYNVDKENGMLMQLNTLLSALKSTTPNQEEVWL